MLDRFPEFENIVCNYSPVEHSAFHEKTIQKEVFNIKLIIKNEMFDTSSTRTWVTLTVIALVLSLVVRYQQKQLEVEQQDDSYFSSTNDADDDFATFDDGNNQQQKPNNRVMKMSRDAMIFQLEEEREILKRNKLDPALDDVARANQRVNAIRSSQSWFPSASEKASLQAAQDAAYDAQRRLVAVQEQERALVAKLKPMLGLVSMEFFGEQRGAIRESLKTVSKLASDNAWWHSIFNLGRAESLTDVLVEYALQYAVVYALAYPFAFLYFALWFAPTTIYAYCESVFDVPMALVMWVAWTALMSLPGIALYFGAKFVLKHLAERERERRGGGGQAFRQANRIFNGQ